MWLGPLSPLRCRILRLTSRFEYCLKNQLQVQRMGMTDSLSNDRVRGTRFFGFCRQILYFAEKKARFLEKRQYMGFQPDLGSFSCWCHTNVYIHPKDRLLLKTVSTCLSPLFILESWSGRWEPHYHVTYALHLLLRKWLINFCSSMNISHRWMDWSRLQNR